MLFKKFFVVFAVLFLASVAVSYYSLTDLYLSNSQDLTSLVSAESDDECPDKAAVVSVSSQDVMCYCGNLAPLPPYSFYTHMGPGFQCPQGPSLYCTDILIERHMDFCFYARSAVNYKIALLYCDSGCREQEIVTNDAVVGLTCSVAAVKICVPE